MTNATNLRADIQLAGVWNNVTSDVYTAEGVTIKRGRQDESSSIEAAEMDLVLNNRTGKYTPGNPNGTFYGQLQKGTPFRLGMGVPPSSAVASSTTANTTFTSPTANVEGPSSILFAAWSFGAVSTVTTPVGYTSLTSRSGNHSSTGWGSTPVAGSGTFAGAAAASTASGLPASAVAVLPGSGMSVVSSQSVGTGVTITGPIAGATTKFTAITVAAGDVLVLANTWSSDPGNSMCTAPQDDQAACEWVLLADTLNANTGPRTQFWARYCKTAATITVAAPGWYYNITDVQAAIWQVRGAFEWNSRFQGECAAFISTADLSGKDVRCTLAVGGVLRRRGQGTEESHSALYRYLSQASAQVYWPLETGTAATALTSPLQGVPNMSTVFSPTISYGSHSTALASDSVLTLMQGGLRAPVAQTVTGTNVPGQVGFMFSMSAAQTTPPFPGLMMATCAGSSGQYVLAQFISSTQINLTVETSGQTSQTIINFTPPNFIGHDCYMLISWAPNLANPATQYDITGTFIDMTAGTFQAFINTGVAGTIGPVTTLSLGLEPSSAAFFTSAIAYGHLFYTPTGRQDGVNVSASNVVQTSAALSGLLLNAGWSGETPLQRYTRLCQEEYIFFQGPIDTGTFANSTLLGSQEIDTPLNIIQEIAITDGGEIAEPRGFSGFTYRPLKQLSAQASAQTLDWNAKQITVPFNQSDDDQLLRNDITATQINGASARVFQATGPLSIQPPPLGVGLYTTSYNVNVNNQTRDLPQIANWYLNVGTTPEVRYGQIETQLAASPSTITAVTSLDVGQRFTIINTPAWVPPAPVDMIAIGFSEVISDTPASDWSISINARPYEPFQVARLDAGNGSGLTAGGLLDSGSSTLTSGVTSVATSLSVTVALADDVWGTGNVPFTIIIGGEEMTVTAVTGATSPQTFTVTRSVNGVVKAQVAGAAVDVYIPIQAGLNG